MYTRKLRLACLVGIACLGSLAIQPASAQQLPTARLANDCRPELTKLCARITPGAGRKVACLLSHSDKIRPRCLLTAYIAGKVLADEITILERVAWQCSSDVPSLCSGVLPGGGRVFDCLVKNKARLLPQCRKVISAAQVEMRKRKSR